MLKREKIKKYKFFKRFFDLFFSLLAIFILFPILFFLILISSIDTKSYGIFKQIRVGYEEKLFTIYKIKTYKIKSNYRVSRYGNFLRTSKIDELPQLFNILKGDMSFVGPRPDIPGYADKLKGEDRIILSVKPGLTGPASIMFSKESEILNKKENPEDYNNYVIWPEKVKLNVDYVNELSLKKDMYYIIKTFL